MITKKILVLLTCLTCSCTNNARLVNDFYYDYDFDLFEDYSPDYHDKTNFGVTLFFESSFVRDSSKKIKGIKVYENESIIPLLDSKPNIDPASSVELPFYKVIGIYKDEKCKQLFNNSDLISVKKGIEEIHLLIKTNEEFQKEKLASKFLSGKWVNKKGMEMIVNYPSIEVKYSSHVFNAKLDSLGGLNKDTIKIDNKNVKGDNKYVYATDLDLLCGKGFDCPKNYVCSYYNCYFLEQFFNYIGVDIEEEQYFEYIEFRSPYKGVEYTF